jgi:hypothetical protein
MGRPWGADREDYGPRPELSPSVLELPSPRASFANRENIARQSGSVGETAEHDLLDERAARRGAVCTPARPARA